MRQRRVIPLLSLAGLALIHGCADSSAPRQATRKPSRIRPTREKEESEEDHDDDPPPGSGETTTLEEESKRQGKLILDATVVEQAIRYPTDLSLVNAKFDRF